MDRSLTFYLFRDLDKTDSFEILTELKTADKHGYIGVAPVRSFNVLGKPVKSASEIRNLYKWGTEPERKQIIRDLYGSVDLEVFELFQKKLG